MDNRRIVRAAVASIMALAIVSTSGVSFIGSDASFSNSIVVSAVAGDTTLNTNEALTWDGTSTHDIYKTSSNDTDAYDYTEVSSDSAITQSSLSKNTYYKLTTNLTNAISISGNSGVKVVIDLNGHSITSSSGAAITVGTGVELTIVDSKGTNNDKIGSVDFSGSSKAATIKNEGTLKIYGGKFTRSGEFSYIRTSPTSDANGKTTTMSTGENSSTSYYLIENGTTSSNGVLYIYDGDFSFSGKTDNCQGWKASLIGNYSTTESYSQVYIDGGKFIAGRTVVKNDEGCTLNISGGEFTAFYHCVRNQGTTNITGGKFNSSNVAVWNATVKRGTPVTNIGTENGTKDITINGSLIADAGTITVANDSKVNFTGTLDKTITSVPYNSSDGQSSATGTTVTDNKTATAQIIANATSSTAIGTVNIAGGKFTGSVSATGYDGSNKASVNITGGDITVPAGGSVSATNNGQVTIGNDKGSAKDLTLTLTGATGEGSANATFVVDSTSTGANDDNTAIKILSGKITVPQDGVVYKGADSTGVITIGKNAQLSSQPTLTNLADSTTVNYTSSKNLSTNTKNASNNIEVGDSINDLLATVGVRGAGKKGTDSNGTYEFAVKNDTPKTSQVSVSSGSDAGKLLSTGTIVLGYNIVGNGESNVILLSDTNSNTVATANNEGTADLTYTEKADTTKTVNYIYEAVEVKSPTAISLSKDSLTATVGETVTVNTTSTSGLITKAVLKQDTAATGVTKIDDLTTITTGSSTDLTATDSTGTTLTLSSDGKSLSVLPKQVGKYTITLTDKTAGTGKDNGEKTATLTVYKDSTVNINMNVGESQTITIPDKAKKTNPSGGVVTLGSNNTLTAKKEGSAVFSVVNDETFERIYYYVTVTAPVTTTEATTTTTTEATTTTTEETTTTTEETTTEVTTTAETTEETTSEETTTAETTTEATTTEETTSEVTTTTEATTTTTEDTTTTSVEVTTTPEETSTEATTTTTVTEVTTTPEVTSDSTKATTPEEDVTTKTTTATTKATNKVTSTTEPKATDATTVATTKVVEKVDNIKVEVADEVQIDEETGEEVPVAVAVITPEDEDTELPEEIQIMMGGQLLDSSFFSYNKNTGKITFNKDALADAFGDDVDLDEMFDSMEIFSVTTAPVDTTVTTTAKPDDTTKATESSTTKKDDTVVDNTLLGDLNLDGEVNAFDVVLMKKHILGISELTEGSQEFKNADINASSEVLADDLLLLKKYVLEIIDSFN